jgi:hypothetical protein
LILGGWARELGETAAFVGELERDGGSGAKLPEEVGVNMNAVMTVDK